MIAIIYLSPWPIGGSTSYTTHFYHALMTAGAEVEVYRLGKRTEGFDRKLGNYGITYRNLELKDLIKVVKNNPSIMTAPSPAKNLPDPEAISKLIKNGMQSTAFDPNEFKVYDHMGLLTDPVLIRPSMKEFYPDGHIVPSPYMRHYKDGVDRSLKKKVAASLARVTFCKNSDMLIQANSVLAKRLQIDILGGVNRMYVNFNLKKKFPDVVLDGKGLPREMGAQPVAMHPYTFNIDLTDFSHINDGGYVTYSFMEAMDAGAVNIIHRGWVLPRGEMKPDVNCLAVESVDEIVKLIRLYSKSKEFKNDCDEIVYNGYNTLKKHAPRRTGRIFRKILGDL